MFHTSKTNNSLPLSHQCCVLGRFSFCKTQVAKQAQVRPAYTNTAYLRQSGGIIDKIVGAIGVNMNVKEGLIEFAKKSSDIGKTGNNYLKFTKFLGKATSGVGVYTAWVDYQNNSTTANKIKLATNIGLFTLKINPFVGIGIGILDLSGGADWMYNQVGDY